MTRRIRNGAFPAVSSSGMKVLGIVLMAVSVSACTRLDDYTAAELNEPPRRHPIAYTPHTEALLVEVPPAGGLSASQKADVVRFVDRYRKEGTGRLHLSAPRGASGHLAATRSVKEVQGILAEAGVDPDAIDISRHAGDSRSGPAVRIAYEKPVALPPQCGDWATDLGEKPRAAAIQQFRLRYTAQLRTDGGQRA